MAKITEEMIKRCMRSFVEHTCSYIKTSKLMQGKTSALPCYFMDLIYERSYDCSECEFICACKTLCAEKKAPGYVFGLLR